MELRRVFLPAVVLLGAALWIPAAATSPPAAATSTTAPSLAVLKKQAATGDPAAQVALGQRLMDSKDAADKVEATTWYRKAAAQGNTDAEWALGSAYVLGYRPGIAQDVPTGLKWLRKSLADGSTDHMANYGFALDSWGQHTHNDQAMKDGVQWIQRAAEAGSAQGMNMLGIILLGGNFGANTPDKADGEHWLLKAARLGNADAQVSLGQMYVVGTFGKPDAEAGLHWLRAAAGQGNVAAEGLLGYLLVSGDKHVPKNPAKGLQWAEKAVAKHGAGGYYAMGYAYQYGDGEPADPAKAWYNFAATQRVDTKHQFDKAGSHLSVVAAKLSPAQIAQMQAEVSKIPRPGKASQLN